MDSEQRQHLEELRKAYWRRLCILELREAHQGMQTPPDILIEIEDLRTKIASIEAQLPVSKSSTFKTFQVDTDYQAEFVSQSFYKKEISANSLVVLQVIFKKINRKARLRPNEPM